MNLFDKFLNKNSKKQKEEEIAKELLDLETLKNDILKEVSKEIKEVKEEVKKEVVKTEVIEVSKPEVKPEIKKEEIKKTVIHECENYYGNEIEYLENIQKLLSKREDIQRINNILTNMKKGNVGEKEILRKLDLSIISSHVLHDFYISDGKNTAQIDFLVITKNKIFEIECKNYSGDISISENGQMRVEYKNNRRFEDESFKMDSPIAQVYEHKGVLYKLLQEKKSELGLDFDFTEIYKPLVVMSNGNSWLDGTHATDEINDMVIPMDTFLLKFEHDAKSDKVIFSDDDMEKLVKFFLDNHKQEPKKYMENYENMLQLEQKAKLVKPIKIPEKQTPSNPITDYITLKKLFCTSCGKEMVLSRNSKFEYFYVCNGYSLGECFNIIEFKNENRNKLPEQKCEKCGVDYEIKVAQFTKFKNHKYFKCDVCRGSKYINPDEIKLLIVLQQPPAPAPAPVQLKVQEQPPVQPKPQEQPPVQPKAQEQPQIQPKAQEQPPVQPKVQEQPQIQPKPQEQPPQERPPQERPPQERPPQERPPQERPPQERPRQERPPQERPRQERPPQERPPQERPPQERPPQERPRQERPPQERPRQERPPQERPRQERPPQDQSLMQKPKNTYCKKCGSKMIMKDAQRYLSCENSIICEQLTAIRPICQEHNLKMLTHTNGKTKSLFFSCSYRYEDGEYCHNNRQVPGHLQYLQHEENKKNNN